MNQTFTIISVIYLVTTLISLFGSFLAWQRRDVKGALDMVYLMIASAAGSFWLIFESAATTIPDKILFSKLEMTGGIFVPVLFFIFVLRFTSMDKYLTTKSILGYVTVPSITLLFLFTNELHHLYWAGFSDISQKTNLIEYYHGPIFWTGYVLYSYILLFLSTVFIIKFIITHKLSFRGHGLVLLSGSILPWSASFFYITGNNFLPGLDLVPIAMTFSGLILIYSVLYTRFLDLIPVARETLVELMPGGILALDKKNRIQDINQKAISYLGITNKKPTGMQLVISDGQINALTEAVLSDNISEQVEITHGDKTVIFSIHKEPLKSQPGSRLVLISDITEHIMRQKQITAAQESYKNMYSVFTLMTDNMTDLLWAKDMEMNYIFANRPFCEKFLMTSSKSEPLGKTLSEMSIIQSVIDDQNSGWPSLVNRDKNTDLEVLCTGKPTDYKDSWFVNGKFIYIDIRKAPIYDEKGEMIGLVGSGHDITREKKAESEIYKRDLLLESIAKATSILIQSEEVEVTIQKVIELLGIATNSGSVRLYRNHPDPLDGKPLFSLDFEWLDQLTTTKSAKELLQNISYFNHLPSWYNILNSGGFISGDISDFSEEEQNSLKKFDIKSTLASPIFVENCFWGFIVFSHYITGKKWLSSEVQILSTASNTIGFAIQRRFRRDELIKAKERAEESDRLKSAFLANVSHEIRTPMNGILGFTDFLREPKLSVEDKEQYIGIIEKSGNRMLNIINDIISISTLEAGFTKIYPALVDVSEQLDFIHNFFHLQTQEKGIDFSVINNLDKDETTITTDREKLYAILTNLTRNAVKFTKSGSIEIGCSRKGEILEFYVRDTGIGIPEEMREIIFERFRQGSDTYNAEYEGTGLGLSISKAYTEMLGGRIWVESEPGKGSTFYFTISDLKSEKSK